MSKLEQLLLERIMPKTHEVRSRAKLAARAMPLMSPRGVSLSRITKLANQITNPQKTYYSQ